MSESISSATGSGPSRHPQGKRPVPISNKPPINTDLDLNDDFITGNFSAKYHTKSNADSVSVSTVPNLLGAEYPLQLTAGFETPSSSLKVLTSRGSNHRRPSGLSSMMSVLQTVGSANNNENFLNNPSADVISIVDKHLVHDTDSSLVPMKSAATSVSTENNNNRFDSLQLQGGDITRDLYNWVDRHESHRRHNSFSGFGSHLDDESSVLEELSMLDKLRLPGGFRRNFMVQRGHVDEGNFLTRNFIEFISIYGHFAGEDIDEEDDEDYEPDEQSALLNDHNSRYNSINSVDTANLIRQNLIMNRKYENVRNLTQSQLKSKLKTSNIKLFILLLKAFLGTGVLFLPKSFSNGGLVYSNCMIICFSMLSYYCFVTLIRIRAQLNVSSYGNLGYVLSGKVFKILILISIILSQIGFSALYIVFVATNIQNLITSNVNLTLLISLQLIFFIPMSLIRKISKLSLIILVSDFCILFGLIYVYYYSIENIAMKHIDWSNITVWVDTHSWSLFIGTAIFTYEGIGLLIPIHESMLNPESFNKLLLLVMIIVTTIFITIGSIAYLSFGNDVKTVILLNFEHSEWVQFIYSVLILLSTPLQLFPLIKMIELVIFHERPKKFDPQNLDQSIDVIKSGKDDSVVKFKKNLLRGSVVLITVLISVIGSSDLDRFVSLIGSLTCVPLIYIFPPLLNIKINKLDQVNIGNYKLQIKHESTQWWRPLLDYLVLVLGFLMMLYTSTSTLYDWIYK